MCVVQSVLRQEYWVLSLGFWYGISSYTVWYPPRAPPVPSPSLVMANSTAQGPSPLTRWDFSDLGQNAD